HVRAEVLAAGRRVQQVQVTATGPDGLAFIALGAAGHPKPGGVSATLESMPAVSPPEESTAISSGGDRSPTVGWHRHADLRRAHIRGHQAHGGFGQGSAHLWSEDGTLLGTASQTARMMVRDV